jgi:hypothetical protein
LRIETILVIKACGQQPSQGKEADQANRPISIEVRGGIRSSE